MSFDKSDLDQYTDIFAHPVWDGNLISKVSRDKLVELGFVERYYTYNTITQLGRNWLLATVSLIDGLLETVGLDPTKIEEESRKLAQYLSQKLPNPPNHICRCGLPYDNPIAVFTGDDWWLGWDCKNECGETDEYSMEWAFDKVDDLESSGFTVF